MLHAVMVYAEVVLLDTFLLYWAHGLIPIL